MTLASGREKDYDVRGYDVLSERVTKLDSQETVDLNLDSDVEDFLKTYGDNVSYYESIDLALKGADLVIIAVPTSPLPSGELDTSIVESVIEQVRDNSTSITITIKSTIPVGFTEAMRKKYQCNNIYFVPEFLREGHTIHDSLEPSRLVIGGNGPGLDSLAACLQSPFRSNVPCLLMHHTEAEVVKLFTNTYLASRVAYFNELDTFAHKCGLSSGSIIQAVSLDPRVGNRYNNPSFGFGGYCLPKDAKQTARHMNEHGIHAPLIESVTQSNYMRREYYVRLLREMGAKKVGIYRVNSKNDSKNTRMSSSMALAEALVNEGFSVTAYEPLLDVEGDHNGMIVTHDIDHMINGSDAVLANRIDDLLRIHHCEIPIISPDIYSTDE